LAKKHGGQETSDQGFDMGDILHDSVLVDMLPDLENNRVTLSFNVICLPERLRLKEDFLPEILWSEDEDYDREILYKFVFEEVSELIFTAGGPEERVPEKRNILTTRNVREFIENLQRHTMEVYDADVNVGKDGQTSFKMNGQLYSREAGGGIASYFEEVTIKFERVCVVDPEGLEKNLEEMAEMGREYWKVFKEMQ